MAFRWRTDDGPLIVVFGSSLPSTTKKETLSKVDPSVKTFWIRAWSVPTRLVRCINYFSLVSFVNLFHIERERERERQRQRDGDRESIYKCIYRSIICLHLSVCLLVPPSVSLSLAKLWQINFYSRSSCLGTAETTRQMKRSGKPGRWNSLPDPAKTDCLGM